VILTRVFPVPGDPIDISTTGSRDLLADLYRPPRPDWVRLNLIGSASGSAIGSDGTSETLTNTADRALLGVIRGLADVVVVGAASVRSEGYFVPRRAALAVVTSSGDLSGHQITTTGKRGDLIVLCPASSAERVRETIGVVEARILPVADAAGMIAAHDIIAALRGGGFRSIVCEGGPQLAAHLVRAGMVDEACLSTSPLLNGAGTALFGAHEFEGVPLSLTQLMVDDGSGVYARWSLEHRRE
jgi:riboflavin biosynthesis pyrimidine reductase